MSSSRTALRAVLPASRRTTAGVGPAAARAFGSSAPKRASHSEGGHGHEESAGRPETFMNATWRNTLILTALAVIAYPYLPSPPSKPSSPSASEDYTTQKGTQDLPLVSRLLAQGTTPSETWAQRNARHLELTIQAAEDKLLFQEAERPRIYRMRFPNSFEQASPHGIAVGTQVDLSDLKVKGDESQAPKKEQ